MPQAYILVTGGAGYIGSHTTLALLQNGYKVVIVDNLCNSYREAIDRIRFLANDKKRQLVFVKGDVDDKDCLRRIFKKYHIDAVVHFAGLKSVTESFEAPLHYYRNNVTATCVLLECMKDFGCNRIVFSSSATVYGNAKRAFIEESDPVAPLTPYGRSKLMCEDIILDSCVARKELCAVILRYFNPVGCHESGLLGENPRNAPNNLMPCVTQAMSKGTPMCIFGNDYKTKDGTPVRDFIHVSDLSMGHVAALKKLETVSRSFARIYNMGNGKGSTVMQVIETMCEITGIDVPYKIVGRRTGDAECVVANPERAFKELYWTPRRSLDAMCRSAWNWQSKNPDGYRRRRSLWKKVVQLFAATRN